MKGPRLKRLRGLAVLVASGVTGMAVLSGPVAVWLQVRERWADPREAWCAVYLVAGARAQNRRINGLEDWYAMRDDAFSTPILIGNDTQQGVWSRTHQRNLTVAEWAVEKLKLSSRLQTAERVIVPGRFFGTDAEMAALGAYLKRTPHVRRLALATCRFHARRVVTRFSVYAPDGVAVGIVPGVSLVENHLPWVVAGELLKLLRDRLGLSGAPGLSRAPLQDTIDMPVCP